MTTKREQKTEDFRQALLNAVGHELNTPLTPVLIHLQFLKQRAQEMDPEMENSFKIVERNVERLRARVQDIIAVTRLDSDRFPIRIEELEIEPLVQKAVDEFRITCETAGIRLELEQGTGHQVQMDPRRFFTLMYNLLDNACRFTPRGGSVTVTTRFERNWFILEIHDSGVGFPPGDKERLFKPFSHLDQPVPHAYGGAGLGLYVSKGIVELHGGSIWGHSEGRHKGATFGFRIPSSQARLFPITFATNTERELAFSKRIHGLV